jgi:hypothetical protein
MREILALLVLLALALSLTIWGIRGTIERDCQQQALAFGNGDYVLTDQTFPRCLVSESAIENYRENTGESQ